MMTTAGIAVAAAPLPPHRISGRGFWRPQVLRWPQDTFSPTRKARRGWRGAGVTMRDPQLAPPESWRSVGRMRSSPRRCVMLCMQCCDCECSCDLAPERSGVNVVAACRCVETLDFRFCCRCLRRSGVAIFNLRWPGHVGVFGWRVSSFRLAQATEGGAGRAWHPMSSFPSFSCPRRMWHVLRQEGLEMSLLLKYCCSVF